MEMLFIEIKMLFSFKQTYVYMFNLFMANSFIHNVLRISHLKAGDSS